MRCTDTANSDILTLSSSCASSSMSKRANPSEYLPFNTNSSICSSQGRITNLQIDVPSLAAAVLSNGVEITYNGDLAPVEAVIRRT